MNKFILTLLLIFGMAQLAPMHATTSSKNAGKEVATKLLMQQSDLSGSWANMTPEEFVKLTPKKIKATTGKKLTFKQVIELNAAQKIVKKQIKSSEKGGATEIDKGVYIILAILIPFLAVGLASDWEGNDWLICLLLSILCWLPGVIYAFIKMEDYYG